jgi:nicotinate dehydrogenase subunit B
MSDGVAMRKLGYTGASHYFSLPHRPPLLYPNTFARESHIDIMAAAAGVDPLDFRLRNLTDSKMRRVLTAAAERFGWKPAKMPSRRGWGIACGVDAGSYVASMAEVEVNKTTGAVQVKRVVCAVDMGLAINPEGARLQIEGCAYDGARLCIEGAYPFLGR